jgi:hypothetical protein
MNPINNIDAIGEQIRIVTDVNLDAAEPRNQRRGWTIFEGRQFSITCTGGYWLDIRGEVYLSLNLIRSNHTWWNKRSSDYNRKWGVHRSNMQERLATYAHESDHFWTQNVVLDIIKEINKYDGVFTCGCSRKAQILSKYLQNLVNESTAYSFRFNNDDWSAGGTYFEHPFVPQTRLAE